MCACVCVCVFSESCFAKGTCLEIYKKNWQHEADWGTFLSQKKKNPRWFLAHRYSAKCPGMGTIWTKIFPPYQTKCKLENRKNTPPHTKQAKKPNDWRATTLHNAGGSGDPQAPWEAELLTILGECPPEHPRRGKEYRSWWMCGSRRLPGKKGYRKIGNGEIWFS